MQRFPWSREEQERLEQELLELHFGCHPDPEALRARLAAEPPLKELQAKVAAEAELLERAAKEPVAELALSTPSSAAKAAGTPAGLWSRERWSRPTTRLMAVAAGFLLVMLPFLALWGLDAWRYAQEADKRLHVTISAPKAVPSGAPWSFTVQTAGVDGDARAGSVEWRALDEEGAVLAHDRTPSKGSVTVQIPASLQVPANVEVVAVSGGARAERAFALSRAAAAPMVHVTTDKPVYRPGEVLWLRALVLDRVTLQPPEQPSQLRFRVLDPKGAPVADGWLGQISEAAGTRWEVPASAIGGNYRLEVLAHDGGFPAESVPFVVRRYQAPRLAKEIVLDRKTYDPGQKGSAAVHVERMAGGAAAGAQVRATLVLDGQEVWTEEATLDGEGRATFGFQVPAQVERGAARFVARITDGGVVETGVEPFVVPNGEVAVAVFPEGGDLVADFENRVYVEVTDLLDRPVDATGTLRDDRGREIAAFRTEHLGRGRLAFTPEPGRSYELRLEGQDERFAMPEPRDSGLVMTALQEGVRGGEALRLRIQGRGDGPWLVGAFCRGVLVGQATVRPNREGVADDEVALALPENVAGVLRVTAFDRGMKPVAERLVQRLPARRLELEIEPGRRVVAPGERQTVSVRATDEDGRPVKATFGLWVTDRAALEAGDEIPGLVDHALLLADAERPEDLEEFLPVNTHPGRVDLLLGTRGWRRFAWQGSDEVVAKLQERGDWAQGLLAREGFSHTPQVHSNAEGARDGLYGFEAKAEQSRERLGSVVLVGLFVLVVFLVGEGAAFFVRRFERGRAATQWATAGVAMVLSVLVLASTFGPDIIGAYLPIAERANVRDFDMEVAQGAAVPRRGAAELVMGRGMDPVAEPMTGQDVLRLAAAGRPVDLPDFFGDVNGLDLRGRAENLFLPPEAEEAREEVEPAADPALEVAGARIARLPVSKGTWVREYAHRHEVSDERADFTETVYFNPVLVTGADGTAEVAFDTSDSVTTWTVRADAHGTGRIGQARAGFDTRLPFHMEATLPVEVSAGDRLELPVALTHAGGGPTEVEVRAEVAGSLSLQAPAYERLTLDNGRGRHFVPVRVGEAGAGTALTLTGMAGGYRDKVRQEIRVVPRGFPHSRSWAGTVAAGEPAAFVLPAPHDPVAGSVRVLLKVFPSPLATLREGLEGMLQEPHGCFEQASSSNYPNAMVLAYVEASGDDLPVVVARARELLPKGYRKIAGYECSERGYEWFGGDPGHEALTAYGLLEFEDMGRVHEVDAEMVARTRQWLLSRRDGEGGYLRNSRALDSFGRAPQSVTDPYVTYALLYSGTPASELKEEVEALAARVPDTGDAYELAVIACALHEAGREEAAVARKRLASMQQEDGSLRGSTTSITSSGGNDLSVETTAFAVLAWLASADHGDNVRQAVEWIQEQKTGRGTFGATQATIMALKALTEYATAARRMQAPGTIRVLIDGAVVAERAFAAGHADALAFDLVSHLHGGQREVSVELEGGGGPLPWACDLQYHADTPADDPDGKIGVRTELEAVEVQEGRTVELRVEVENRSQEGQPMTLAVVGLPAGLDVPTSVLDDLQEAAAFDLWEIRGREVILYWRGLAPGETKRVGIDLIARIPGTSTGPASRAYLYYTPDQKRWAQPVQVEIEALR